MTLKKRNLEVLPIQRQEPEINLAVQVSGNLCISWRWVCGGGVFLGGLTLVAYLVTNPDINFHFNFLIERNPTDSTELQR